MSVDLMDHNKEAYEKIQGVFNESNKTCVVQPTGSGKTYLILKLIEDYKNLDRDIIVIEPQRYIFAQIKEKMNKYDLPEDRVKFITYSALGKMDCDKISKFTSPCLVVVDEMHRAGARTWIKGLQLMFENLPKDCKYIGLSATPIRYLDGKRDMCEELFDGNIANEISLPDAIIKRILPLPRYIAGLYTYENEVNAITKKIKQSSNSEKEKEELLEEVKQMKRNLDKSKGISTIFKKYIVSVKGKYVAFCREIKHLQTMKGCLEEWLSDAGIKANMYEVHYKNPNKNEDFHSFKNDTGLAVCLSVGMLSEGIHGIDGVILLRDTISPNLYYQQIGRAFAVEMESVPVIFDLVANCESVMDCGLKKDLLDAIDKRDKEKKDKAGIGDDEGEDSDGNEITKEDIENFFVFDQVLDAISAFKGIEGRLKDGWNLYIQALIQYKEREGDCLVPSKHIEVMEDGKRLNLGNWVRSIRRTKNGEGSYTLTSIRLEQLDKLQFIWDVHKYNFKNAIDLCVHFYNEFERLPSEYGKYEEERKLGMFLQNQKRRMKYNTNYPSEYKELLDGVLRYSNVKEDAFDIFCEKVLLFKEKCGHTNIKKRDVVAGYNIGKNLRNLYTKYKLGKLSDEQITKLKYVGVDITMGKIQQTFNQKMLLAIQAINDGVIIDKHNQVYKGVNFYNWYYDNKKKFSEKEIVLLNKLVPNRSNKVEIRIIDVINDKVLGIYESVSEAGKALCIQFHVVSSNKTGRTVIYKRLSGATKNPVFRDRFRFEYANPEDCQTTS